VTAKHSSPYNPLYDGRGLAVTIEKPGRAPQIARNGWKCCWPGCRSGVTTEVSFVILGPRGDSSNVIHGTCDKHAEPYARRIRNPKYPIERHSRELLT